MKVVSASAATVYGYMEKEKDAASAELSKLISGIKSMRERQQQPQQQAQQAQPQPAPPSQVGAQPEPKQPEISTKNVGDSVLMGLPITEQIAELEAIEEGLASHTFSEDQIATIRDEIKAISDSGGMQQHPGDDLGLISIRDKRLAEIEALLK
jgi:hypothetical protein